MKSLQQVFWLKSLADPTIKTIRRKFDVDKENKLKSLRDLLEKKHITLNNYVENIIETYDFEVLERKRKWHANSKDLAESDSDSDDLNETDDGTDSDDTSDSE